ncbi:MAG: aspartate carbamoyltransferase catalytic subunit [Capsulimonas sp.]|uniref:aspartate carbamoyltransferase catalytic subunit n=1 Tax=Capsulimonas sp. TaxID=2494211 RepID=UPI0032678A9A
MRRKDLLDLQSLTADEIVYLLDTAASFKEIVTRPVKKAPTLRGKSVATVFFEPSTRTRTSFEHAAKIMSADTYSLAAATSSATKGESLKDTMLTLDAMGIDVFVIRHSFSGAAALASKYVPNKSVINAGDGTHEHPTQGLLDLMTIREKKGQIEGLEVAIVGDIAHSRVARSNIWGLHTMGAKVRLVGPSTLMPADADKLPVKVYTNLDEGLRGADVVNVLRIQLERQDAAFFPSVREYAKLFGVTHARLKNAASDVTVLHPGPMNRGVEISSALADDGNISVIEEQVTNGVAMRMAVLFWLMSATNTISGG